MILFAVRLDRHERERFCGDAAAPHPEELLGARPFAVFHGVSMSFTVVRSLAWWFSLVLLAVLRGLGGELRGQCRWYGQ